MTPDLTGATIYEKLESNQPSIRLLKLNQKDISPESETTPSNKSAGTKAGTLNYSLTLYSVSEAPEYRILSFASTNDTPSKSVYVRGTQFPASRSLEDALRRFQGDHPSRIFWTDAICINQQHPYEVSAQNATLADVVPQSKGTLIWLGTGDEDLERAMREMRDVGSSIDQANGYRLFYRLEELPDAADSKDYQDALNAILKLMETRLEKAMKGQFPIREVSRLLALDYWNSNLVSTIFQASSDIEIVYGDTKVPFKYFHGAMMFLPVLRSHVVKVLSQQMKQSGDSDHLTYMMEMSSSLSANSAQLLGRRWRFDGDKTRAQETLFDQLARTHVDKFSGSSSHQVDKVIPLLKKSLETSALDISLRAAKSINDIYTGVARAILESGELDLLSLCQSREQNKRTGLPSWVPDWRFPIDTPAGQLPRRSPFNASGTTVPAPQPAAIVHRNTVPQQLHLQGFIIDTIETTRAVWQPRNSFPSSNTKTDVATIPIEAAIYLRDIMELCALSSAKLSQPNVPSIYRGKVGMPESFVNKFIDAERAFAPTRVPIADQEPYGEVDGEGRQKVRRSFADFTAPGLQAVLHDIKRQGLEAAAAVKEGDVALSQSADGAGADKLARDAKEVVAESTSQAQELKEDNTATLLQTYYRMMARLRNKRPFLTKRGFVGLGPAEAREGDIVVVVLGAKLPYVLRGATLRSTAAREAKKTTDSETLGEKEKVVGGKEELRLHSLVGEAYLHGVMYGQFVDLNDEKGEVGNFVLV